MTVQSEAYTVKENSKSWTVRMNHGAVGVTYNVSKEIAPDAETLEKYIRENNLAAGRE